MASRFHALQVDDTGSSDEEDAPLVVPPTPTSLSSTANPNSHPTNPLPSSTADLSVSAFAPTSSKKSKSKKKKSPQPTSSSISASHTTSPLQAAKDSSSVADQIASPVTPSSPPSAQAVEDAAVEPSEGLPPSRGASLASLSTISSRPSPSPSVTSDSESELSDIGEDAAEELAASNTTAATTTAGSIGAGKGSLASRLPGLAMNGSGSGSGRRRDSNATNDGTVVGSPVSSTFANAIRGSRAGVEGPTGTLRGRKPSRLGGGSIDEGRGDAGEKEQESDEDSSRERKENEGILKKAAVAVGAVKKEEPPAGAKQGNHGKDHDPKTKWKSMINRTIFGFLMAGGFIGLLAMGPVYMIVLVMASQAIVFSELSSLFEHGYKSSHPDREASQGVSLRRQLAREKRKAERERWSKVMSWYFFAVTNYFLYGETIIYYFKHIVLVDAYFIPFARHHRFISFMLYVIGFVGFVTNLDRNHLRRQFGLFCWIHMTLVLIVFSSHFIVDNILEGLIWLWIPASLVIMNDVAAYVFGMAFGRTQLIALSPKKTVEGFVGAFFATVVFAFPWSTFFMQYPYLICPVRDLGTSAFADVQCNPNQVFVWREYHIPESITEPLHIPSTSIPWAPFQLHSLVMAVFASLVAPFGGFFASGFKRAFNIKDFGDSIPGHGGLTDRFDCQFLMGLFSYVYYSSLIREHHVSVGAVLQTITTGLEVEDQVQLFKDLQRYLAGQGISY